jgi:nucleotide-binding universal stress UspA family protein
MQPGCRGTTIRHILVPLDGSPLGECALPFATAMARPLEARLTLLRVLETRDARESVGQHVDAVAWEVRRAEAHGQLARLDHELKAIGLTSAIELLDGRPAEQIVNFARGHAVDLIVLSSHGEGGLSGWSLSSTAQKVVARAHCSVLIVPAYAAEGARLGEVRFRRILVPLDCSPRAESVLPLATALARAHDADLILAHVVPEPEMPRRMPPSAEDVALASQLTERNRLEAARYLDGLRDRLLGEDLRVEVRLAVSTRRVSAIRQLADQDDVDLAIVCAHGRTGNASERYGSVVVQLIQGSIRPMLVFQDLAAAMRETTRAEEAAQSHPGH